MSQLLFDTAEWDFDTIRRINDACAEIAFTKLGLDTYPNQIEIVSSEQMLDAYASIGLPHMYKHWSFGKHFVQQAKMYSRGQMGLAYEIVINSSPCIAYLMEENTATMQALVIAHACYGHNHFFKNNYLFKQWTDAEGILAYIEFAKNYIAEREERFGSLAVETTLDAAHALRDQGVHRYSGRKKRDLKSEAAREIKRAIEAEAAFNDLWRTVPKKAKEVQDFGVEKRRELLGLPEENILYFLEKKAPRLQTWQREILRIVRSTAQYFYPQRQTKVMNEGCATYVHYQIMSELYDRGLISDGSWQEFIASHTNVIFQPEFDDRRFRGFNPYALGFAMMRDIEGIATGLQVDKPGKPPRTGEQLAEDKEWFPAIAGKGDPMTVLRDIWANYRDESFILQYLSPRLMREFRMFHLHDDPAFEEGYIVEHIHNDTGYRGLRKKLAEEHDVGQQPNIQITDVDLEADRRLEVRHFSRKGKVLNTDTEAVMQHLADLWSYDVSLEETDESGKNLSKQVKTPRTNIRKLWERAT